MADYREYDRPMRVEDHRDQEVPTEQNRRVETVLEELNIVQHAIDVNSTRKRELIHEYKHLQERNAKMFDSIVNRPEEGEVAMSLGERY